MSAPLLAIDGLSVGFAGSRENTVRNVSLSVATGEIVGLIGESGSGKSLTASAVLGLLPRGARATGRIFLEQKEVLQSSPKERTAWLGSRIAYVPQDPMSALNPTLRVVDQLAMPLRRHLKYGRAQSRQRSRDMLARMQIADPDRVLDAYPFELSGGLRQRVLLANAFLPGPRLVLADEPTTALDVTVQAEVLALLEEVARTSGTSVLLITHNIAIAWRLCNSICVMKRGEIVEQGLTRAVLSHPVAGYTRSLRDALPERAVRRRRIEVAA